MENITALFEIDYVYLVVSIFTVLFGIKAISSIIEWVFDKLGLETKWMRNKRKEHELLIQTSENLSALQKKHTEDVKQSIAHDERIKNELESFMAEMRDVISGTQNEIKQFYENRVHDREQSFKIQKELTDNDKNREKQIESLTVANRELLAGKINDRYKYYISIGGIPEDEVDEFTALHSAYKACGGNHHGDAKYNYVMEHLPVIPVETKLIYK